MSDVHAAPRQVNSKEPAFSIFPIPLRTPSPAGHVTSGHGADLHSIIDDVTHRTTRLSPLMK